MQAKKLTPVRFVSAECLSTGEAGADPGDPAGGEKVCVISEAPLTLDLAGGGSYTILCTPTDTHALAVGFLFSEGMIDSMADIAAVKPCDRDPLTLRIHLQREIPRASEGGRNLLIVSSCGACGNEGLTEQISRLPEVGDGLRVEAGVLRAVCSELDARQRLFAMCGGAHAALLFDATGVVVSFAEDVGRHNALDKAIGMRLMDGASTAGLGVALTSRLSLEMVGKCARAGIELIAAVSAPTSLAIEVAERCDITLCAFVRETRATVFTHPRRLAGGRRVR